MAFKFEELSIKGVFVITPQVFGDSRGYFAETFKALSDPTRREILKLLKNKSLSAGEIGSNFEMTGATLSYHLNILKKADLVFEHREKNFIIYELNTSVLEEIIVWIADLKGDADHDVEKK